MSYTLSLEELEIANILYNMSTSPTRAENNTKKRKFTSDDDFNNFSLPNNYIRDSVLYELYTSNEGKQIINNNLLKMFLIRIWVRWLDKYVYYIGTANNILDEVIKINDEYECCGKIIFIAGGVIKNNDKYREIKNKLTRFKFYSDVLRLVKPINKLYHISVNIYDLFVKYISVENKKVFDSKTYILEKVNDNIIESIHKDWFYISDLTDLKIVDNNFVLLDSNSNETLYWIKRRNYVPLRSFI